MRASNVFAFAVLCMAATFVSSPAGHAAQVLKSVTGKWGTDQAIAHRAAPSTTPTGNAIIFDLAVDNNYMVTGTTTEFGVGLCDSPDTILTISPGGTLNGKTVVFTVLRPGTCPNVSTSTRGGGGRRTAGTGTGRGGGAAGASPAPLVDLQAPLPCCTSVPGAPGTLPTPLVNLQPPLPCCTNVGGAPGAFPLPPGISTNSVGTPAPRAATAPASASVQTTWTLTLSDDEQQMRGVRSTNGGSGGGGRGGQSRGAGGTIVFKRIG